MGSLQNQGPLECFIDGHVLRVNANQFVTYPDTAVITPTTEVDAYYPAVDAAYEAGDPLYDVGSDVNGVFAKVRSLPEAGPQEFWEDGTGPSEPWADNITCYVGFLYTYAGDTWICIQGHPTQADWTPDVVPALFNKIATSNVWDFPVQYEIDDVVLYPDAQGDSYICIQAHTSQSDFTPPATPALWSLQT